MPDVPGKDDRYQLFTCKKDFTPQELKFPLRGFFHAQHDTPPHRQEFAEVVFFLHGEALHYTEATGWKPARRGDVWSLPPGGVHGYRETKDFKIFNLLFIPDRLPLLMLDLYDTPGYRILFGSDSSETRAYPYLRLASAELRRMEAMLRLFVFFHEQETDDDHAGKYGMFMAIISRLCRLAAGEKRLWRAPLSITRIHQFLNSNCAREITIADLCRLTAMAPTTLHRHFLRYFGMPPMQYIRRFRLQIACRLLLNTTLPIREIAARCGFPKHSYFTQIFRSVYRTTPGEYRNAPHEHPER